MPYHDDLCHLTDLRHFASSSGGLVVSIEPDTGTLLCCICDEFTYVFQMFFGLTLHCCNAKKRDIILLANIACGISLCG